VCTSCDGTDGLLLLDGVICKVRCDLGYVEDLSDPENYKCVQCNVAKCKICDINFLDVCLECMEGYYVFNGTCVPDCPTDYRIGNERKACVKITINDLGIFYFPFLMVATIFSAIVIFGSCKKKEVAGKMKSIQNTITALCAFISFVLFFALIAQAIWSYLFGTMKYFFATVAILAVMLIYNLVFLCVYIGTFRSTSIPEDKKQKFKKGLISKDIMESFRTLSDPAFAQYVKKHRCMDCLISVMTLLFTFKCNKMYYSHFYSFDMFKARWSKGEYKHYRKLMTVFCIVHMVIDAIIFCIAVAGLYALEFMSNMLYVTMVETAVLSVIVVLLGLIELFKMKEYLAYNEIDKKGMNKASKNRLRV